MALNPDQIEQTEFGSSLRGFDKQEVRAFLARVARSMRQAEAELAAKAPVAAPPVPPKPALSEMSDEDRFGALGERIANLLRNAHDSAAQIKATAEAEVAEIRIRAEADVAEAQAEVERLRAEAEELRATAEADAIEIRAKAETDGLAKLDGRQAEIEANELVIQQDQERALAELAEARGQVSVLLEQARAQSEFIRLEADDIIREKIRANLDAAEGRLSVLRNTEEISRERIRLAQNELESALGRLESEPAPELPHGTEHLVIEEAEHRAIEAGYVVGAAADNPPDDHAPDDHSYGVAEADVIDVSSEQVDAAQTPDLAAEVDALVAEADGPVVSDSDVDEPAVEEPEPEEPVFGTGDATETPVENEDALTKLVREAMQTAVETARSAE